MNNIQQDNEDSRDCLIQNLFIYIDEARNMTRDDLILSGDYKNHPELRYPQTQSEHIVDSISTLLASNDLIDDKYEPILDEMLDLSGKLDIDAAQPDIWKNLFALADELKKI